MAQNLQLECYFCLLILTKIGFISTEIRIDRNNNLFNANTPNKMKQMKCVVHDWKHFNSFVFVLLRLLKYVNTKPVSEALLTQEQEECCTVVENSHSYRWEKRVTQKSMLTPGKGPLIKLYDTPFYHQTINRKLCYRKERSDQSSFCESGVCKQQYVKQKVLSQEIGIESNTFEFVLQYIWVPSGCQFVKLNDRQTPKNFNNSSSQVVEIRVIRSDSERIDSIFHDVLNSRASFANINYLYFSILWPFIIFTFFSWNFYLRFEFSCFAQRWTKWKQFLCVFLKIHSEI